MAQWMPGETVEDRLSRDIEPLLGEANNGHMKSKNSIFVLKHKHKEDNPLLNQVSQKAGCLHHSLSFIY